MYIQMYTLHVQSEEGQCTFPMHIFGSKPLKECVQVQEIFASTRYMWRYKCHVQVSRCMRRDNIHVQVQGTSESPIVCFPWYKVHLRRCTLHAGSFQIPHEVTASRNSGSVLKHIKTLSQGSSEQNPHWESTPSALKVNMPTRVFQISKYQGPLQEAMGTRALGAWGPGFKARCLLRCSGLGSRVCFGISWVRGEDSIGCFGIFRILGFWDVLGFPG